MALTFWPIFRIRKIKTPTTTDWLEGQENNGGDSFRFQYINLAGPQGFQGGQGAQGSQGVGTQGPQGSQGSTGAQGSQGPGRPGSGFLVGFPFTESGTYTANGETGLLLTMIGPGAGGESTTTSSGGKGGGSGEIVEQYPIPCGEDEVITVHVGTGGAAGMPGDDTYVIAGGITYFARSGKVGQGGGANGGTNVAGAGAIGTAETNNYFGGGGGGNGGSGANPGSSGAAAAGYPTPTSGGAVDTARGGGGGGANSPYGLGGDGGDGGQDGSPGVGPGSGGGGAGGVSSGGKTGGVGQDGYVLIQTIR